MHHLRQVPDINHDADAPNQVRSWAVHNCEDFPDKSPGGKEQGYYNDFFPINRRRRVLSGFFASYKRFAWKICG